MPEFPATGDDAIRTNAANDAASGSRERAKPVSRGNDAAAGRNASLSDIAAQPNDAIRRDDASATGGHTADDATATRRITADDAPARWNSASPAVSGTYSYEFEFSGSTRFPRWTIPADPWILRFVRIPCEEPRWGLYLLL